MAAAAAPALVFASCATHSACLRRPPAQPPRRLTPAAARSLAPPGCCSAARCWARCLLCGSWSPSFILTATPRRCAVRCPPAAPLGCPLRSQLPSPLSSCPLWPGWCWRCSASCCSMRHCHRRLVGRRAPSVPCSPLLGVGPAALCEAASAGGAAAAGAAGGGGAQRRPGAGGAKRAACDLAGSSNGPAQLTCCSVTARACSCALFPLVFPLPFRCCVLPLSSPALALLSIAYWIAL